MTGCYMKCNLWLKLNELNINHITLGWSGNPKIFTFPLCMVLQLFSSKRNYLELKKAQKFVYTD